MNQYPAIPPASLGYARQEGLSETKIVKLWKRHCDYVREHGHDSAGGQPWTKLVQMAKDDDDSGGVSLPDDAELERRRASERKAKDLADAAYDKHAVSFSEYLDSLLMKRHLTPVEERVLEAGTPPPGTDLAVWIFDAVAGPKNAKAAPRKNSCACDHPVHAWTSQGSRYEAHACKGCLAIERRNAARAAGEIRR